MLKKNLKISGLTGNQTLKSALCPVIAKVRVRFPITRPEVNSIAGFHISRDIKWRALVVCVQRNGLIYSDSLLIPLNYYQLLIQFTTYK